MGYHMIFSQFRSKSWFFSKKIHRGYHMIFSQFRSKSWIRRQILYILMYYEYVDILLTFVDQIMICWLNSNPPSNSVHFDILCVNPHLLTFCWPNNHLLIKFESDVKFSIFWCIMNMLTFCWILLTFADQIIIYWLNSDPPSNSVHFDVLWVCWLLLTFCWPNHHLLTKFEMLTQKWWFS